MKDIKYPHLDSQRIDNFLFACFRKIPKPLIYRLLRKKNIKLNGKTAKPLEKLNFNDIIRVPDFLFEQNQTKTKNISISESSYQNQMRRLEKLIIYQDHDLLIINKPMNMPVHAGSSCRTGLIEIFKQTNPDYELAHRLDKKTTGCLIIAKNRKVVKKLYQLFRLKKIQKHYLAICYGHLAKSIHKIDLPLYKKEQVDSKRKVEVDFTQGKPSITYIRKTKWLNLDPSLFKNNKTLALKKGDKTSISPYSLVYIQLGSGRTHQIRVHLSYLSHPIMGDDRYNSASKSISKKQSLMLHCQRLVFNHPLTEKQITVEANLPSQFQTIISLIPK